MVHFVRTSNHLQSTTPLPSPSKTMKLSLIALATLFSDTGAFAPVKPTTASHALYAMDGDEIREARTSFAPGHFTTIGSHGDAGRSQCNGEDVREARSSYAPGQFDTIGSRGDAGRSQCNGEDVREGRSSYAPFGVDNGRVGSLGEIGTDGVPRREYIPASEPYIMPKTSPEFVPHSSTGAGGHSPAAASSGAPKSYALGGGGKPASGAGTGATNDYFSNL